MRIRIHIQTGLDDFLSERQGLAQGPIDYILVLFKSGSGPIVPDSGSIPYLRSMHAVSQNETPTQSFCDKRWQIWTNFNNTFTIAFCDELRKTVLSTRHLISNLLPHYLAKFEFSAVQLYTIVIISVTYRLFTGNIYRNVIFWIICLCKLIYNFTACVQNIRHQLCVVHATLSMYASMTRCCNAVPSCSRRCRNSLCWHTIQYNTIICNAHKVE